MREMTRKSNLDALKGQAKKCFLEKKELCLSPRFKSLDYIAVNKEYKTESSLEVVMD